MDINKEREAFEKHASKFFKTNEAFEDDGENYVYDEVKFMWDCWLAAKAHEAEKLKGCVLVSVQCPDPDFADSLFDELSKKAIGEFGDDLLIHFSDIDEEKIWALMVEAAKAQAVPEGFVLVPKELSDEKADIQASLSWSCHLGLFKSQNRDMSATEIEEFRLKWCRNKARDLQEEYKAMIEAQEQSHD